MFASSSFLLLLLLFIIIVVVFVSVSNSSSGCCCIYFSDISTKINLTTNKLIGFLYIDNERKRYSIGNYFEFVHIFVLIWIQKATNPLIHSS